mmetsp:Transcript_3205/g.19840  ORF Transcript_3205/g.19840 Transcript_3205/m.19840 type:complete len:217 (+) Transcript_3205:590-1240(+)
MKRGKQHTMPNDRTSRKTQSCNHAGKGAEGIAKKGPHSTNWCKRRKEGTSKPIGKKELGPKPCPPKKGSREKSLPPAKKKVPQTGAKKTRIRMQSVTSKKKMRTKGEIPDSWLGESAAAEANTIASWRQKSTSRTPRRCRSREYSWTSGWKIPSSIRSCHTAWCASPTPNETGSSTTRWAKQPGSKSRNRGKSTPCRRARKGPGSTWCSVPETVRR